MLANADGTDAVTVETAYRVVREEIVAHQADPAVAAWAIQFYRVTMRYWRGLFHCYDVVDLPRTNNDLEQYFGSARQHERRATGRKCPPSAVAVRGAVRVVAAVATRLTPFAATELRPREVTQWHTLRQALEARHEARRIQRRFRRDPAAFLAQLEAQLLQ